MYYLDRDGSEIEVTVKFFDKAVPLFSKEDAAPSCFHMLLFILVVVLFAFVYANYNRLKAAVTALTTS